MGAMAGAILWHYAEEHRRKNALRASRRLMRDATNPMDLPEREFVAQFRLNKAAFQEVFHELSPLLRKSKRCTMIRDDLKILAALNFYGTGSYQRSVATSYLHNMSQPTLSNCLDEVTNALNNEAVLKKYIKFPRTRQAREAIMTEFMDISGMPGTIGCIDGTHIAIIRPTMHEHEEAYFNRKGYHSINVLAICDAKLNILHVNASYGGASHDSFIWNQSRVKEYMEQLHRDGEICWLLGDSGYAQKDYMMIPILGAEENSPEELYTQVHCSTRNSVERSFGGLKSRYRCMLSHRLLNYTPVKAGKIVNACAVLHNIANAHNVPIPQLTEQDREAIMASQMHYNHEEGDDDTDLRSRLIQRLWAARATV